MSENSRLSRSAKILLIPLAMASCAPLYSQENPDAVEEHRLAEETEQEEIEVPVEYEEAGLADWYRREMTVTEEKRWDLGEKSLDTFGNNLGSDGHRLSLIGSARLGTEGMNLGIAADYEKAIIENLNFGMRLSDNYRSMERGSFDTLNINELVFDAGIVKYFEGGEADYKLGIIGSLINVDQVSGGNYPDWITVPMFGITGGVKHDNGITFSLAYLSGEGDYRFLDNTKDVDANRISLALDWNSPNSEWFAGAQFSRLSKDYQNAHEETDTALVLYAGRENLSFADMAGIGLNLNWSDVSGAGSESRAGIEGRLLWEFDKSNPRLRPYLMLSAGINEPTEANKEDSGSITPYAGVTAGVDF